MLTTIQLLSIAIVILTLKSIDSNPIEKHFWLSLLMRFALVPLAVGINSLLVQSMWNLLLVDTGNIAPPINYFQAVAIMTFIYFFNGITVLPEKK